MGMRHQPPTLFFKLTIILVIFSLPPLPLEAKSNKVNSFSQCLRTAHQAVILQHSPLGIEKQTDRLKLYQNAIAKFSQLADDCNQRFPAKADIDHEERKRQQLITEWDKKIYQRLYVGASKDRHHARTKSSK